MNPSTFDVHHIFTYDGCVLLCSPDGTIRISASKTKSGTSFASRPVEPVKVTTNPDAHHIAIADIPDEPGHGVEFTGGGVRRPDVRLTLTRSEIGTIEESLDEREADIATILAQNPEEKDDYAEGIRELGDLRRKLTLACGGKA